MQVGSLVKCIGTPTKVRAYKYETISKKGDIHTVRSVIDHPSGKQLLFGEIVNKPRQYNDAFGECRFAVNGFIEIQPPMDINALLKDLLYLPNEISRLHPAMKSSPIT